MLEAMTGFEAQRPSGWQDCGEEDGQLMAELRLSAPLLSGSGEEATTAVSSRHKSEVAHGMSIDYFGGKAFTVSSASFAIWMRKGRSVASRVARFSANTQTSSFAST